ncbi:MAG TPA: aminodeoxychorismate synthase component I [Planctomycetaceae bacterium]
MSPLVHELSPVPDPLDALRRFADLDGTLLLESALRRPRLGRYTFLAADPFRRFRVGTARHGVDPLTPIADALRAFPASPVPGLPPFQGGAAGLLGYDLADAWERLPAPRHDEFGLPVVSVGLYDGVLAWDHAEGRAWIVSQGFPAHAEAERRSIAEKRLRWMLDRLAGPERPPRQDPGGAVAGRLCPQFPLEGWPEVTSTFSRDDYLRAVERVVEYIRAGDVFQANLSQRLLARWPGPPIDLYARLREANPAPFAAYYAAGDWAVVSSSPERFVQVRDGEAETRPIKGTRPRSLDPAQDERLRSSLQASEKDRAENVMIVDLLRNDLSKVCRPGTVRVPELCSLETYETVHHLVSAVTGTLEPGKTAWDLIAACFPGGSVTGAPKVRATEILRELEPTARGPYCGSLFYVGFDGACDSSLLIRTAAVKGGWVQFGVGGGVTASSDPQAEYEETLDKARGMLKALES